MHNIRIDELNHITKKKPIERHQKKGLGSRCESFPLSNVLFTNLPLERDVINMKTIFAMKIISRRLETLGP